MTTPASQHEQMIHDALIAFARAVGSPVLTIGQAEDALGTLAQPGADLLAMRFGLDGYGPMSLDELSQRLHIPRERAAQMETAALSALRHPSRNEILGRKYMMPLAGSDE